jgi:hypothetical protein
MNGELRLLAVVSDTTGIAPLLVYWAIRIAVACVHTWLAEKGGPKMINLSLPRAAPVARESLCYGCVFAHIVQGYLPGEELIVCGYAFPPREVPFPVRACTDFRAKQTERAERLVQINL